jgi:hypothetical protein
MMGEAMTAKEYLDRPPPGWFVLDIMKRRSRSWDWSALVIDIDPEDLRAGGRSRDRAEAWVRIPGKHRHREAAWEALQDVIATRH